MLNKTILHAKLKVHVTSSNTSISYLRPSQFINVTPWTTLLHPGEHN